MGSDQLIELLSKLAYYLLPVAGLVLLVYLILFIKALVETMKTLNVTLKTTEEQIRKLDQPLETLDDVSATVDQIHKASKGVVAQAITIVKDGVESMIQKKTEKSNVKEENDE